MGILKVAKTQTPAELSNVENFYVKLTRTKNNGIKTKDKDKLDKVPVRKSLKRYLELTSVKKDEVVEIYDTASPLPNDANEWQGIPTREKYLEMRPDLQTKPASTRPRRTPKEINKGWTVVKKAVLKKKAESPQVITGEYSFGKDSYFKALEERKPKPPPRPPANGYELYKLDLSLAHEGLNADEIAAMAAPDFNADGQEGDALREVSSILSSLSTKRNMR